MLETVFRLLVFTVYLFLTKCVVPCVTEVTN